jgi:hypothetical protein
MFDSYEERIGPMKMSEAARLYAQKRNPETVLSFTHIPANILEVGYPVV